MMTDVPVGQGSIEDIYFMNIALSLAAKGRFTTKPNPCVGCVIVKNGLIIGQGYHPKAGQPHAEVFAIRSALEQECDVTGATAYVTLEPCSHTGRTPPCADTLIKHGISRVVVAILDPNPKVSGRGVARLQGAGIDVLVGVCQEQARKLNAGFLKAMATGLPYVRLKMAMSIDGKVAMATGESKWISGDASREDVQTLRAMSSAIITGSGTILADDPRLNVRSERLGLDFHEYQQPKIVVIDRRGRLDEGRYQVQQDPNHLIWQEDLPALLQVLVSEHQCYDVLVEAGAGLSGAFIEQGLVDELVIYQAPCILGRSAKTAFDFDITRLSQQRRFCLDGVERIGDDLKMVFL